MLGDLRGINCGEDETDKKLVSGHWYAGSGGGSGANWKLGDRGLFWRKRRVS